MDGSHPSLQQVSARKGLLRAGPLDGMIPGMKTTKIAVSLPPLLVEQARRAVRRGLAPSVSAYVARALEERAKLDDLTQMLDDMLAESGGPMTNDERRETEEVLGIRKRRKRRAAA